MSHTERMHRPRELFAQVSGEDLEHQAQADALRADLAALLGRSGGLSEVLGECCHVLVECLQVALVRIWTLLPDEQILKLQASAGLYTHIDGSHARVPIGQYKIGLIASQRRPQLTNCVLGDNLVHDQDWARRERLTAFAGYPLLAEGDLVGVLAMFSRRQISPRDFANLEIIAVIIANYIRRKNSEQALQASEARFRTLAESVAVIPWEADAQSWEFTYVGPQAARILGYPVARWYEPGFWVDHIHPDDREYAAAVCRERMESGETHYQFEYRMLKADGNLIWFLDIVNVVYGDGGAKSIQGFLIDITERKTTEQNIQDSQQRLQLMADALPVLIAYIDGEGRYQFNNAAYEQWFGLPAEAFRGRLVRDVLGEAAYGAIREYFEGALAGETQTFEQRVPYSGAGTRDVHVHYVPHLIANGKVAGFFALTVDVSQRKQAEEALRDREARLRAILNTAADGIITFDDAGTIESLNPVAERLFGYAVEELIGQNVNVLMPSPFREGRERNIDNYSKTGIKHLIGTGRELLARRKDGTVFPIELSVSEISDGRRWFTGIVHDLTRRKALEGQVLEVSAQEQQRIARELHDGVGQELTGLSLLADALARRLPQSSVPEQKLAVKLARGLERVHQQVRALCRGLIPAGLDPDALRLALQDLTHRTTEQTGVECLLECPEHIPLADSMTANHLYRIVQEAVSNALRHGRPQHIWVCVRFTRGRLRVGVRDDGVGVTGSTSGSQGMGIPTMRYRANMIGGILQIRAARGGGTLVTCTLNQRDGNAKG